MEFYRILQDILDKNGLSIPEAARLSGLSDSTVRTILARQNKSVSLEVAFKLSSGLGVSMEQLNGEDEDTPSLPSTEVFINDNEIGIILAYRNASDDDKNIVDSALRKYLNPRYLTVVSGADSGQPCSDAATINLLDAEANDGNATLLE